MNDEQLLRYSRHIFLPEIDIKGQEKLLSSTVLLVGLGGLGSATALYLAASGVGQLMLADREVVDLSNLQRQIIHQTQTIGEKKTTSASRTLKALNPDIDILLIDDLNENNLNHYVEQADVVCDGSDNFTTRFAINRACAQEKVPLVCAAAIKFSGQLCVFDFKHQQSPCYQCLYPDGINEENRCQDSGVISPLVGIMGSLQALEVVKLLLGRQPAQNQLLQFDALTTTFKTSTLSTDPDCPICKK